MSCIAKSSSSLTDESSERPAPTSVREHSPSPLQLEQRCCHLPRAATPLHSGRVFEPHPAVVAAQQSPA